LTGKKTGLAEQAVQDYIDGVCVFLKVAHYHTKFSMGSQRGFLDSICVGPGGIVVFECKDDTGKTTPEQDMWTRIWQIVGVPVFLVRPEDMRPRADLGGKSLIHHEIARIATGPDGQKFPQDIVAALALARSEQARRLAAQTARRARARTR
jgi:hypothetical protein